MIFPFLFIYVSQMFIVDIHVSLTLATFTSVRYMQQPKSFSVSAFYGSCLVIHFLKDLASSIYPGITNCLPQVRYLVRHHGREFGPFGGNPSSPFFLISSCHFDGWNSHLLVTEITWVHFLVKVKFTLRSLERQIISRSFNISNWYTEGQGYMEVIHDIGTPD